MNRLLAAAGAALFAGLATASDLAGTVSGPNGPEAGVWVIAETQDLPTKFARIVVTDDQGRYLVPDLPKASYEVWVRGYGLVDSPKVKATPGETPGPHRGAGAERARGRAVLPGDVLVLDDARAARERLPRRSDAEPGRLAARDQAGRLPVVPRARHAGHAHGAGDLPQGRRGDRARSLARARHRRKRTRADDAADEPARRRGLPVLRAVDRRDREGRAALRAARAAEGRRAQPRGDDLGLERAAALPPRPHFHRPPESARQRARPPVRLGGRQHRLRADPRSAHAQLEHHRASGARPRRRRARATTRSGLPPTGASSRSGTAAR